MNLLILKLFFILSGLNNSAFHPMHVSICNMEVSDTSSIVAVKLFKDDLSLALKNNYQADMAMDKANEKINSQYISQYINSCLQIEMNKSEILKLDYTYSELNKDAIWVYFTIENANHANRLRIKNTLMLDLWSDQTNLLIISWHGKENGYRFNHSEVEIDIDLNT